MICNTRIELDLPSHERKPSQLGTQNSKQSNTHTLPIPNQGGEEYPVVQHRGLENGKANPPMSRGGYKASGDGGLFLRLYIVGSAEKILPKSPVRTKKRGSRCGSSLTSHEPS